jgi:zinc transporter 1/2/3
MLLIVSFIGITIPVYLVRVDNVRVKYAFDMLRCISIGLILGVAFLHMLPEANGMLEEAMIEPEPEAPVNETATEHLEEEHEEGGHGHYPFAFLFASLGVCLMLFLEQVAEHLAEKAPAKADPAKSEASAISENVEAQSRESHGHGGDLHSHHDATLAVTGEDKMKAYVIEISISLHSILIGVGLGVLSDYADIEILLVALCFHQLFEGIALGGAVVKADQSKWFLGGLIFFFSFSCPIGVAIGAGIANTFDPQSGGLWTQGVLYSIACGTLFYIGLYDLMAQSFQKKNPGAKKFGMVGAVLIGVGLMALLAVWA